jgi:Bacterial SH3 domain
MTSRASLCLLALMLTAPAVRADPAYVIEQLVVSVTSAPDAESERIGQVKSGDKLELIEREGDETHVRLSNGKDGWVKSSYLTADPPLQTRLTERTAEVEKLKQEADKLRQEVDKLKQDVSRLEAQLAASRVAHTATSDSPPATADAPPPPAPVHDTVFLRSPDRPGETAWPLVLGSSAVMLLVGFAAGWKMLDRRIRRKYGGLRIY